LLCECIGILSPFLMVISITRTASFSKTTLADLGATFRMCSGKAVAGVSGLPVFQGGADNRRAAIRFDVMMAIGRRILSAQIDINTTCVV